MKNSNKPTRSDNNEKNRTISKVVTLIIIVTIILMLVIFGVWLIGGGEENASDKSMETFSANIESESKPQRQESSVNVEKESNEINKEEKKKDKIEEEKVKEKEIKDKKDKEEEEEKKDKDKVKTEEVKPSDDNVASAVTGDWEPAETNQKGTHTTNYNGGSQDRTEIKQASANATNLSAEDIIEWRVENNGDQKVVATISDTQQTKTYRVFLNWIDNEGWQPTKVEQLKVNDKQ